jgi:hypothetical protein
MKADTFYFPHDYHSHLDPKCSALIGGHGMAGYGLYWSLIEILHEQGGRIAKFPKLYDGLAFQLKMDKEILSKQIEAMLHDYELLLQDDKFIWSERVLRNIAEREAKKMLRADAGKIGGINSGISRRKRSKTKQCFEANEANEPKERKEKERKEKKITTFVVPTVDEIYNYCQERKKGIDAQVWFDYYTANGWMVGRNKMKDWKAAVRTWEQRKGGNGGFNQGFNRQPQREEKYDPELEEIKSRYNRPPAKLSTAGKAGDVG